MNLRLRWWSWGLLCLLSTLPGTARALPGMGVSSPFPVDTVPPHITVVEPRADQILFSGTAVVFSWQRQLQGDDPASLVDRAWVLVNGIPLDSLTIQDEPRLWLEWNWIPPEISSGDCRVVVRSVDKQGNADTDTSAVFSIVPAGTGAPGPSLAYRLPPPHPNPFNPATSILFSLPAPARIHLAVYDERGRRLAVLSRGTLPAGDHLVQWNGRDATGRRLAAGTYLLRLDTAGRRPLTRKVVLLP